MQVIITDYEITAERWTTEFWAHACGNTQAPTSAIDTIAQQHHRPHSCMHTDMPARMPADACLHLIAHAQVKVSYHDTAVSSWGNLVSLNDDFEMLEFIRNITVPTHHGSTLPTHPTVIVPIAHRTNVH